MAVEQMFNLMLLYLEQIFGKQYLNEKAKHEISKEFQFQKQKVLESENTNLLIMVLMDVKKD